MKLEPQGPNAAEVALADGTRILFSYKTPVAYIQPDVAVQYHVTTAPHTVTTRRHIRAWVARYNAPIVKESQADINFFVERL